MKLREFLSVYKKRWFSIAGGSKYYINNKENRETKVKDLLDKEIIWIDNGKYLMGNKWDGYTKEPCVTIRLEGIPE